jgi:hypothetical protein
VKTFDEYIDEINLVEFLIWLPDYDLQLKNSKRSSGGWKYAEFKNSFKETIVVMRRREAPYRWFYFNRVNDSDKGNLINLVKDICGGDFKRVNDLLREYSPVLSQPVEEFVPKEEEFVIDNVEGLDRGRVGGLEYLLKRGLSAGLMESVVFKGSVWRDKYNNCVFPLFDLEGEVKGLEKRYFESLYFSGKSMVKGSRKTGCLWYSNSNEAIKELYIGEAPLDLLSVVEMEGISKFSEALMVSTNGAFGMDILTHIHALVNKKSIKKVIGCFDKDFVGVKYALMLLKSFITADKPSFAFLKSTNEFVVNWNSNKIYKGKELGDGLKLPLELDSVIEFINWMKGELNSEVIVDFQFPLSVDFNSDLMINKGLGRRGLIRLDLVKFDKEIKWLDRQIDKKDQKEKEYFDRKNWLTKRKLELVEKLG